MKEENKCQHCNWSNCKQGEKCNARLNIHEHRYWPNSRQKSDVCIICGFNPIDEECEKGTCIHLKKALQGEI